MSNPTPSSPDSAPPPRPTSGVSLSGLALVIAPLAILATVLFHFGKQSAAFPVSKNYILVRVEITTKKFPSSVEFVQVSETAGKFKLEAATTSVSSPLPSFPTLCTAEIMEKEFYEICQILEKNGLDTYGPANILGTLSIEDFARSGIPTTSAPAAERLMKISWSTPVESGGREVKSKTIIWSAGPKDPEPEHLIRAMLHLAEKHCPEVNLVHLDPGK